MGLLMLLVLLSFWYNLKTVTAATFDVTSYDALVDGITDDTQDFVREWAGLCGDNSEYPKLIIPPDMTFLLSPVVFNGSSCVSPTVNIKLLGSITTTNTLDGWKDCAENRFWICFTSVRGLVIDGPGQIDGQGSVWCKLQERTDTCQRPSADWHNIINNLFLHISIIGFHDVDIGYLHIRAPVDIPNTDGIDISSSSQISIHDSNIQTGDDCVAINGGVIDKNVTRMLCGPGHGKPGFSNVNQPTQFSTSRYLSVTIIGEVSFTNL